VTRLLLNSTRPRKTLSAAKLLRIAVSASR